MEQSIEGLEVFYDITLDQFVKEQLEAGYLKFSDNPYYLELRAYVRAMNVLREFLGWNLVELRKDIVGKLERVRNEKKN